MLRRLGRTQDALAVLAPFGEWVRQQNDPSVRMLWLGDWGATLADQGRLREAISAYDDALIAAREARECGGEGQLLLNCSIALRRSGQFDRGLAMAREGRAMLSATDADANAAVTARLVVARDEAGAGLFGRALPELEAVLAEYERRGAEFWVFAVKTVLARLWIDLGQFARAVPMLRDDAEALPAWLRADRGLLRLDLAQAMGQQAPAGLLQECLALAEQDDALGLLLRVRALRHQPPEQFQRDHDALALALRAGERLGGLMGLHLHHARAALALGRPDHAAAAARALVALFDEGYAPDSVYRAEAWWVAHQALQAAGQHEAARDALRRGEQWLRQVVLPQVPPPFLNSFLHRNPVNRALLLAAGRAD
jgi:tetratricopeptide (TPR) repeat protein